MWGQRETTYNHLQVWMEDFLVVVAEVEVERSAAPWDKKGAGATGWGV
jgi:hypothetical protein